MEVDGSGSPGSSDESIASTEQANMAEPLLAEIHELFNHSTRATLVSKLVDYRVENIHHGRRITMLKEALERFLKRKARIELKLGFFGRISMKIREINSKHLDMKENLNERLLTLSETIKNMDGKRISQIRDVQEITTLLDGYAENLATMAVSGAHFEQVHEQNMHRLNAVRQQKLAMQASCEELQLQNAKEMAQLDGNWQTRNNEVSQLREEENQLITQQKELESHLEKEQQVIDSLTELNVKLQAASGQLEQEIGGFRQVMNDEISELKGKLSRKEQETEERYKALHNDFTNCVNEWTDKCLALQVQTENRQASNEQLKASIKLLETEREEAADKCKEMELQIMQLDQQTALTKQSRSEEIARLKGEKEVLEQRLIVAQRKHPYEPRNTPIRVNKMTTGLNWFRSTTITKQNTRGRGAESNIGNQRQQKMDDYSGSNLDYTFNIDDFMPLSDSSREIGTSSQ